jgi:hypothetical protein
MVDVGLYAVEHLIVEIRLVPDAVGDVFEIFCYAENCFFSLFLILQLRMLLLDQVGVTKVLSIGRLAHIVSSEIHRRRCFCGFWVATLLNLQVHSVKVIFQR